MTEASTEMNADLEIAPGEHAGDGVVSPSEDPEKRGDINNRSKKKNGSSRRKDDSRILRSNDRSLQAKTLESARRTVDSLMSDEFILKNPVWLSELKTSGTSPPSLCLSTLECKLRKLTIGAIRQALREQATPNGVRLLLNDRKDDEAESLEGGDQDTSPKSTRITRDFSEEMIRQIMSASIVSESFDRTVEVINLRQDTDVWTLLGKCGELESVENGTDERGRPRARAIFKEVIGAVLSVEQLSDVTNWRGGLRITLASGLTPAVARRNAGLPRAVQKTEESSRGMLGQSSGSTHQQNTQSSQQSNTNGRHRGRLAYLKPGKFGFVKPYNAKNKEDNAFFSVSELLIPESSLVLGDWLEYTPETVVDKLNGETKKQAKQVTKYQYEDRRGSHSRSHDRSAEMSGPPGDRPDRLRGYGHRLTHSGGLAPGDDLHHRRERIARGPDGTNGFTRLRSVNKVHDHVTVPSDNVAVVDEDVPTTEELLKEEMGEQTQNEKASSPSFPPPSQPEEDPSRPR